MGFFNKLFNSDDSGERSAKSVNWIPLNDMTQLDEIVEASKTKTVAIFKHSTRCGISSMVIRQFEGSYDIPEDVADVYYLDLLQFRPISNEIASRFGVFHQSPQLLIFRNGEVVFHTSHGDISTQQLAERV
ncbi:bacillithiol system redox-active protein YtxJ [Spongiivirga citrea]|uniref:Bacillithiol system redox-active protein YtxJ n=1 Tax=Spongiivirga citrea TaxID=1481457 RepID=A0A6M0CHT7_9FLAO|nr:bacillithiol system redox-active protein YtxJ [Spongiivirga citrea]NER17526.1 bacillithiol system redox-active protein YtxJ [Spongiivirga citrea]